MAAQFRYRAVTHTHLLSALSERLPFTWSVLHRIMLHCLLHAYACVQFTTRTAQHHSSMSPIPLPMSL